MRSGLASEPAKQLFSQARQEHIAGPSRQVPPEVLLRMSQLERAVELGRGPTKLKDSCVVEEVARVDTNDHTESFPGPHPWARALSHRMNMVVVCCWWMLRGIEAATVRLDQAWAEITHSRRTAFITLPCTKTDIVGLCVTRSHPCCCHVTPKLCPFHALQRHLDWGSTVNISNITRPSRSSGQSSRTGATMQRPGPGGMPMERFCEHVCRVSGAQMLTRRGFPLDTVQLIGRWGSDAIKVCVCVQEAPLHRGDPHFRPKEITKPQQVRQMVEHYLETLRRKFGFNTITKVVYLPGVSETSIDSTHWHSICGWPYGLAD